MHTINCRIRINEYQDIQGRGITPAEALLLRHLHDPAAHNEAASNPDNSAACWKFLTFVKAGEDVKRTNGQEIHRLKVKYPVKSKSDPKKHLVDELFPGLNPNLPESFSELGLEVSMPEPKPEPTPEAKQPESKPEQGAPEGQLEQEDAKPETALLPPGTSEAPAAPKPAPRRVRKPAAPKAQVAAAQATPDNE